MTRETKIGLLVGLAFIIVIGILLSDHVKSTTEPIAAPLPDVAGNVLGSVRSPGANDGSTSDTVVNSQQPVTPRQPVPTQTELGGPHAPQADVVVGGPSGGQRAVVIGRTATPPAPDNSAPDGQPSNDARTPDNTGRISDALNNAARQNGEPLVPVGTKPDSTGPRKYTAQSGDTLSHMAARFMGGNTKANRDAIIKANASLAEDPNKIIAGRVYVIPAAPSGETTARAAAPDSPAPAPAPAGASADSSTAQGEYWYTVKPGDNLWSIAASELGTGTASAAIKELNKDVLKGGDAVRPNMRLRLPAKPISSASAR